MAIRYVFVAYIALIFGTLIGLDGAKATVLYEVTPAGDHNTPAVSSAGTVTAFDDFILPDAATVTSVRWIGRFSTPGNPFRVGFYDSTSQTSLFALPEARPLFEVTASPVETVNPLDSVGLSRNYELDLGAGLSLDGDTRYFISIMNVGQGFWQWQNDPGGLGVVQVGDGDPIFVNATLFFSLDGEFETSTEPPIALSGPPIAAILGLGLIGISLCRYRPPGGRRSAHNLFPTIQKGSRA